MDLPLIEFEPLSSVIKALPRKIQRGLFTNWVDWTSLDVTKEYIAVGTDVGIVCLLDRSNNRVQRLRCKGKKDEAICAVKMCYSVDYVVAAGTVLGNVYVFLLPSTSPGRPKEMHMFTVLNMHPSPIRVFTWSPNAMKLFSGDEDGQVVCTEFDYEENKSASYVSCKEPHAIVDLDYSYRALLVSTRFRTIVCYTDDNNRIEQVGSKDRKILGEFGAVFVPGLQKDTIMFVTRPGLRLWRASIDGTVQNTMLFKDLITGMASNIDVLEETVRGLIPGKVEDRQFGPLLIYQETQLVTWHGQSLYVIDPGLGVLVGYHTCLGNILSVAVCEDEIFVLRQYKHNVGRPLLRIAQKPDLRLTPELSPSTPPLLPSLQPPTSTAALNPSQILADTAATMSSSIMEAFNKVGEKIQAVQLQSRDAKLVHEGERVAGETPPWGSADTPGSTSDRDTAHSDENEAANVESPTPISMAAFVPTMSLGQPSVQEECGTAPGAPEIRIERDHNPPGSPPIHDSPVVKKKEKVVPVRKLKKEKVVDLDAEDEFIVTRNKVKKKRARKEKDTDSLASTDSAKNTPRSQSPAARMVSPLKPPNTTRGKKSEEWPVAVVARPATPPEQIESTDVIEPISIEKDRQRLEELEKELTKLPGDEDENAHIAQPAQAIASENPMGASHVKRPVTIDIKQDVSDEQKADNEACAENKSEVVREEQSVYDVNSSMTKDNASKSSAPAKKRQATRAPSSDDFYSKYKTSPAVTSPYDDMSIEDALEKEPVKKLEEDFASDLNINKDRKSREEEAAEFLAMGDTWTEVVLPGQVRSLAVNSRHAWIVDKNKKLYYSHLSGPGLKWHGIKDATEQLAVSPSGHLVWRVYNSSLYVATKITTRQPAGSKWVEAAREVAYASVDDHVGWYCKINGEVVMQKGLSRERPCYRSEKVPSDEKVVQVCCFKGVVWALTKDRIILVRAGVTAKKPEGTSWGNLLGSGASLLVSNFDLGEDGTAWIIDLVGRVWFTTGITPSKPKGDGEWWQASMSEYLMKDSTALDTLKQVLKTPQTLAKMVQQCETGGLVTARCNGVWICPQYKNIVHVCKGGLTGHQWEVITPEGIVSSVKWNKVMAGAADSEEGFIWSEQPNGGLFCFTCSSSRLMEISPPDPGQPKPLQCLTGTSEAVWGLTQSGKLYIRVDMGSHCRQGLKWTLLDTAQLGDVHFTHISCGTQNIWGVTKDGQVLLRIGLYAPSASHLNPVWVPVEGTTNSIGAKFTAVYAGPLDWMVWAIDSKNAVYVRRGVSDSMPIGTHWLYVPGIPAMSLTISQNLVYARSLDGEILVRHGICPEIVAGSYWRKIPGAMASISVRANDDLWGINKEGQLTHRITNFLQMKKVLPELQGVVTRGQSVEEDWELL